jgi:hypothetical protein
MRRQIASVMERNHRYPSWSETDSPKVSERTATERHVIPLVSREEAEKVFSSQRLMSLEESWRQVDKSLGRLSDTN